MKRKISADEFAVDFSALPSEDPIQITDQIWDEVPDELGEAFADDYHLIRTNYDVESLGGIFTIRLPLGRDPVNLQAIHSAVLSVMRAFAPYGFRINIGFSFFFKEEDPEPVYGIIHGLPQGAAMWRSALFVTTDQDKKDLLNRLNLVEIWEHLEQQVETTKMSILHLACIKINAVMMEETQFGGRQVKGGDVPDYLRTQLVYTPPLNDEYCFFFCLAEMQGFNTRKTADRLHRAKELAKIYCDKTGRNFSTFHGGKLSKRDFPEVEKVFNISLVVYEEKEDDDLSTLINIVYYNKQSGGPRLDLFAWDDHLSRIKDIKKFCGNFRCPKCNETFARLDNLKKHLEKNKKNCAGSKPKYTGSIGFRPRKTLHERLQQVGIDVTSMQFDLLSCWDIETLLVESKAHDSSQVKIKGRHSVVAISITSNVDGYDSAKVFIDFDSERNLVTKFLDYAREISLAAEKIYLQRHASIITELDDQIEKYDTYQLKALRKEFLRCCRVLRIYGCHSSRFDLPVCLHHFLKYIDQEGELEEEDDEEDEENLSVVRAGGKYLLFEDKRISLRDVASIQACSLDQFIICWGGKPAKLAFPFDLLNKDVSILDHTGPFPARESFASSLKSGELPSEEIYQRAKTAYEMECGQSMRRYFEHYSAMDVAPLAEALSRMISYFREEFGVNFLVDTLTISGMAEMAMFNNIQPKATIILGSSEHTADLHNKIRAAVTGGFSAILHKIQMKGNHFSHLFQDNLNIFQE